MSCKLPGLVWRRDLRLFLCLLSAFLIMGANNADESKLREIKEVLWPKAYREQDVALLDRILAQEFQSIDDGGEVSTKEKELDYIRKNKPSYQSFRYEIKRLEIFENRTAVVSGTGTMLFARTDKAKPSRVVYQSSNVFIERDGRWQAVSSHVSGIKKTEL